MAEITDRELLIRIDERTMKLEQELKDLKNDLHCNYATKLELDSRVSPLEKISYGAIALTLTSIGVAILSVILK